MNITRKDVIEAVAIMSETIPFFPKGDLGIRVVHESIESMVSTKEQLDWLVKTACCTMRHFLLPELRGIFCTRYPPKDGIYTNAETQGFTPDDVMADIEASYHQRESEEFDRKLIEWKREAKQLRGSEKPEPFELPSAPIKAIPAPKIVEAQEPGEMRPSLREAEEQLKEDIAYSQRRTDEEKERLITELQRELSRANPVNDGDRD